MFEFLFGFILGVWACQALPLPSVGIYVQSYFVPKVENKNPEATVEDEEELRNCYLNEHDMILKRPAVSYADDDVQGQSL